ncbi:hypothetical protein SESBI_33171 [Sesbania bispinosa]|nr:hypothetical protein SESBI_33171 [Sesbania bispinosa]
MVRTTKLRQQKALWQMKNELSLTKEERTIVEAVHAHCVPPSHCLLLYAPPRLHFLSIIIQVPIASRYLRPCSLFKPKLSSPLYFAAIDVCYITSKSATSIRTLQGDCFVASRSGASIAPPLRWPSPHLLVRHSN